MAGGLRVYYCFKEQSISNVFLSIKYRERDRLKEKRTENQSGCKTKGEREGERE